jgi:Xaa-Pro aminopeptidase
MKRLKRFRDRMAATGLEGFAVTNTHNVRYLSGFSGSTAAMFITAEEAVLVTDFRYDEQAHEEAYEGVEVRIDKRETMAAIGDMAETVGGALGFESGSLPYAAYENLKSRASGDLTAVDGMPEKMRAVKDDEELGLIGKAVEIADRVFTQVVGELEAGMTEVEVAARIDFLLMTAAGDLPAFRTIVAGGPRGALPHAHPGRRKLAEGDLVTMDFGAVWNGYCSDMTRTVVLGDPTAKQREIYDTVLDAQKTAIAGIKAGMPGKEADSLARDLITERGYGERFGHGLGHGIGLEVHESPRLSYKTEDKLLAGMVVTVEPGIYVPGWGGVRIEDNVVVEEGGCRVLTSSDKNLLKVGV